MSGPYLSNMLVLFCKCTPDVIFPSVILCWINPSWLLWMLKVKCDLDLWPHTWPWPWIFKVNFWNSCISEWEGWLTLHKGGGSRSFMTMTVTIWWPRSGVWIYQIVTGLSVVGVPSTDSSSLNQGTLMTVVGCDWGITGFHNGWPTLDQTSHDEFLIWIGYS